MNINPLFSFSTIICVVLGLILLVYQLIYSSLFTLVIALLLIALPIVRASNKKKSTKQTILNETTEHVVHLQKAHHSTLKSGYLGTTKNFLFFVPFKKSEQPIIIRGSFLQSAEVAPFDSGNVYVQQTSFGALGSNIKWLAFHCSGITTENESFNFSWIIGDGKIMKKIKRMDNVDFETSVGSKRKLF